MKSIALLTMVFLPATFFSVRIATTIIFDAVLTQVQALFSTTFFTYGDKGWVTSHRFWIYWAITVPVTILVLIAYALWFSGRVREFVRQRWFNIIRNTTPNP